MGACWGCVVGLSAGAVGLCTSQIHGLWRAEGSGLAEVLLESLR